MSPTGPLSARPDVFLSYSREDQATARRFADALRQEGFNVWWDQTLSTGEAYDAVTEQALDSARSVVVLWSPISVTSRWVRAEATTADRNGVLMPVMIGACRRPVMFELMQTAELGHWQGDANDPAWRAFVADLKRLVLRGQPPEAAVLLERAARQGQPATSPAEVPLTPLFTAVYTVKSTPEGADVYVRDYSAVKDEWLHVGRTPLEHVELPRRPMRWRFEKEGFLPVERANSAMANQAVASGFMAPKAGVIEVKMWSSAVQPEDMVYVLGGALMSSYTGLPRATVPSFFLDRHEVTNAQYKEFVDAGGYERRQYWEGLQFVDGGKPLSFEEAMKRFVDSTGRPGPATWELGSFPDGTADYPVAGVSWYEASAYARFRNRALPSAFHWTQAAMRDDEIVTSFAASVVPLSNFGTPGPAPVGQFQGVGGFGTYDLYGNVREWVSNPGPAGGWVLGGNWEDPTYSYADMNGVSRMERSPLNGFRLMKPGPEEPDVAALHAEVPGRIGRTDIRTAKPVGDELYALYSRQFAYRPGPLNATAPETMSTTADWIKQRVTIDTGYEGKRMDVILFVPRNAQPPFEPIILFSGMHMFIFPATREGIEPGFAAMPLDFIVKSGRVLVQPIYEGTFERFKTPLDFNDEVRLNREYIAWRWDLGRTIDYLESRTDIDAKRIGYIGLSFGSSAALPVVATEPRLKAAVLVSGGIPPQVYAPNVDPLNYASRIRIPVLMFNGRFDAGFTVEGHQEPLFRLLGTPPADKKHLILNYGHASPPRAELLRESLAWFDKYLGPVGP